MWIFLLDLAHIYDIIMYGNGERMEVLYNHRAGRYFFLPLFNDI